MSTVIPGSVQLVAVEPGDVLTVTADLWGAANVRRVNRDNSPRKPDDSTPIPVGSTRRFGPYPVVQFFRLETTSGSLSYTQTADDYGFATQKGNVEGFTGNRLLVAADNGKVLRCDDNSSVTVTVPAHLPEGFNCCIAQWGLGTVTFAAASGGTKRSSTSAISAQFGLATVIVMKNSDDASAEFVLGGAVA